MPCFHHYCRSSHYLLHHCVPFLISITFGLFIYPLYSWEFSSLIYLSVPFMCYSELKRVRLMSLYQLIIHKAINSLSNHNYHQLIPSQVFSPLDNCKNLVEIPCLQVHIKHFQLYRFHDVE